MELELHLQELLLWYMKRREVGNNIAPSEEHAVFDYLFTSIYQETEVLPSVLRVGGADGPHHKVDYLKLLN